MKKILMGVDYGDVRTGIAVSDSLGILACGVGTYKAKGRRELIEIDYEPASKPDKPLSAGCVVTIRGKGKFILRSLSEQTKKGRYRLVADQYV